MNGREKYTNWDSLWQLGVTQGHRRPRVARRAVVECVHVHLALALQTPPLHGGFTAAELN